MIAHGVGLRYTHNVFTSHELEETRIPSTEYPDLYINSQLPFRIQCLSLLYDFGNEIIL